MSEKTVESVFHNSLSMESRRHARNICGDIGKAVRLLAEIEELLAKGPVLKGPYDTRAVLAREPKYYPQQSLCVVVSPEGRLLGAELVGEQDNAND